MAQNFIACDRGQSLLLPPDLTDWVPDDHVVWSILGAVDQMDLSAFYGAYRANGQGARCLRAVDDGRVADPRVRAREPVVAGDRAGVPGGRHLQADHRDGESRSFDDRGVPPPAREGARRVVHRGAGAMRRGWPGRGWCDLDRWREDPRERVAGRTAPTRSLSRTSSRRPRRPTAGRTACSVRIAAMSRPSIYGPRRADGRRSRRQRSASRRRPGAARSRKSRGSSLTRIGWRPGRGRRGWQRAAHKELMQRREQDAKPIARSRADGCSTRCIGSRRTGRSRSQPTPLTRSGGRSVVPEACRVRSSGCRPSRSHRLPSQKA